MSKPPAFHAQIPKTCWHCEHLVSIACKTHLCAEIAAVLEDARYPVRRVPFCIGATPRYVEVDPDREGCQHHSQLDYNDALVRFDRDYVGGYGGAAAWEA